MPERLSTFPNSRGGGGPEYNTDYTLSLTPDKQELKLAFKQSFLQAHEWSNGDISPEITFTADDGRKFGKKFSMNLKVNTAPVLEYAGIGKTATADSTGNHYYVLIFRAKDMGTMIGTQHVHKDINTMNVTVGGVSRPPITLSVTGSDFATGGDLLASTAVASLDGSSLPSPTAQDWILRLKTDVKVGGPETEYSVSIKDSQGLSSAVISAKTKKNKLPDVKLFDGSIPIPDPADSTSEGATAGNPKVFAGMSGKTLTAKAAPDGAAITGTISRFSSSAPGNWTQTDTVSGTTSAVINLPALDASETQVLYKISLKAQLSGYDDSDSKDFFVKLVRQEVPVLKLKQDFGSSYASLYCISAAGIGYVKEDIIPYAGNYNNSENALVIYNMGNGQCKFELTASAGSTVNYKLDNVSSATPTATATITVISGAHKLEVWAERDGTPGPHTTVHINVVNAVSNYTQLKNVVQNAPEKGMGAGQYDYSDFINIKIGTNLTASSADTEIEVSGGKKLMLSSSVASTVRTINANNNGRIFKISGTITWLILENIKLERGYAADGGGAVHVETTCQLLLKGNTVITPSTGGGENTPGKNDVYLVSGASINVKGVLEAADVARITPQNYSENTQVLIGHIIQGSPHNYTKFSVTQRDDGFLWTIKNDGKLQAIPTTINGSDSGAWKRLKEAVEKLPEGSTITINGEITATNEGTGTNANWGEIVIDKNLTIQGKNGAGSDILNANSSVLSTNAHRIFNVKSGKKLTLKNLTFKNGKAPGSGNAGKGGAVYVVAGGKLDLTQVDMKDNYAASTGGAVYFVGINGNSNPELTVQGGEFSSNKANDNSSGQGGAFALITANAKMEGVKIKQNFAGEGAGIYVGITSPGEITQLTLTNYGTDGITEISNNGTLGTLTASNGGGIYFHSGRLTIQNGVQIKQNKAEYGGGIYVKNGTINMENCTLSSNTALYGGGIQADNGNHTVKDCTLTNNEAYFYGGGIYVIGGSLTLNNTTIGGEQFYDGTEQNKSKGNKAKYGGGVYIEGNGTSFTMNGGSIQYNKTTDGSGGGVYIKGNGTSFTMNGGKITQCKADVTSSHSMYGRGGGICGEHTSSPINITIKGTAEISHNESTCQGTGSGGGIYGGTNNIITVLENATIKNNKAKGFGGGVYIKGTFKFTGGTITGNTITLGADKLGAGIFSENSSTTLKMSGNARVTNDNDIYLNRGSVITITDGPLTGTAPVARIKVADDKYLTSTQVLTAGTGVTLANETYKFAVTPNIVSGTPQPWTVGGNGCLKQGRYTEVPYGKLAAFLANASSTEVNYIEVTGITASDLKGTYASPPNPGPLGALLNNNSSKKVALKLPNSISGLTDMSACFSQCENLVSLENFPSGVTDMRACFYGCENLTTVPAIPATVTSMMECFRYCRSLTTVPNIPSEVYDMTRCFQYCEKLQSIKMNCPYRVNFNGAFSGCDALPDGGIKVPLLLLAIYKNNAGTMGTTPDKFSAIP